MLDARIRPLIDPHINWLAARLGPDRLSANMMTWIGFGLGLVAMAAIANQAYLAGLFLFGLNRLADGLDGAVARHHGITDLGGYLDITLDFIIYSAIVFGFALADPPANALPAAFLIFSFIGTGGSFLAFAVIAAKRGIETEARGKKSLFYLGGLMEGTETIIAFILFCLFPGYFAWLALIFGVLCWLTTIGRIKIAYDQFA